MSSNTTQDSNLEVRRCSTCGNRFPFPPGHSSFPPCPGCQAWEHLLEGIRAADSNLLAADAILPDLKARTKRKAVHEIVCFLAERGYLDEPATGPVTAALLQRESLATTGIGHGIAIPHTKHAMVRRSVVAIARSTRGVDFESMDNRPVRVIAMALSPTGQTSEQLRILSKIARPLRDFDIQLREAACEDTEIPSACGEFD